MPRPWQQDRIVDVSTLSVWYPNQPNVFLFGTPNQTFIEQNHEKNELTLFNRFEIHYRSYQMAMLFRSATFGGHNSFREIQKQTFGTIDLANSLKHPNFPKNPDPSIHHANLKPSLLVAITHIKPSFLMVLGFKGSAYFEDPKTPLRHTGSNPLIGGSNR